MSREALRLAEEVGCLPAEAESALTEGDYIFAREALETILELRRRRYATGLTHVWHQFVGGYNSGESDESVGTPTSLEAGTSLGITESISFVDSLGLELEDPLVLAVAYELQSPEMGVFHFQPFIDGWARLEAESLDSMRAVAVPQLRNHLNTLEYFRQVYRFTYRFVLKSEESGHTLTPETAKAYWKLLLQPRYPETILSWLKFQSSLNQPVSSDTWNMLLEFCEYVKHDPQMKEYDETSAWPAVFDDYAEWRHM